MNSHKRTDLRVFKACWDRVLETKPATTPREDKGNPPAILAPLKKRLSPIASILDLGCGTGLSTQLLSTLSIERLVGCDLDPKMVEQASVERATFVVAPAESLPFSKSSYDAVTTFGAFHWFCTGVAIDEISRVLKRCGLLFIVSKEDAGPFRQEYEQIITREVKGRLPRPKESFDPPKLVPTSQFSLVDQLVCQEIETLSRPQALAYCRSISLFRLLSSQQQKAVDSDFEALIERHAGQGLFVRPVSVRAWLFAKQPNM